MVRIKPDVWRLLQDALFELFSNAVEAICLPHIIPTADVGNVQEFLVIQVSYLVYLFQLMVDSILQESRAYLWDVSHLAQWMRWFITCWDQNRLNLTNLIAIVTNKISPEVEKALRKYLKLLVLLINRLCTGYNNAAAGGEIGERDIELLTNCRVAIQQVNSLL